ncbi:formate dehydrogenase accessory sulfurtransferase FdhD [Salinicoccus hispanicus]|uniref:Sulfur carrier protein FdhD n=1 Tax=Salinicoccus hispanicus TaxID=157225 RepID=A0A6N8U1Y8_9STAP|nr:formate dehydrogenase accessory sulfurtransferase FdhD [Salinicoccus hispanicus]
MKTTSKRKVLHYSSNEMTEIEDAVAEEFPLTIYLNDVEFATLVCSPEHLEEMVIGFLASEGVIRRFDDIEKMNMDERGGFCHIHLADHVSTDHFNYSKRIIGSCCGKSRQFYFQNDADTAKISMSKIALTPIQCIQLIEKMQQSSTVFKETGGIHNASIGTAEELIVHRGDIGRHNALDKLYGYCLKNHITVRDKVLVFSGRISSEVLTKSAKIGVGIVLSKSAPTNLAIKMADDLNITTVGFIRGNSFNIYSHSWRIEKDSDH